MQRLPQREAPRAGALHVHSPHSPRSADRQSTFTAILSIRNTSPERAIHIRKVDHFSSESTLLTSHLDGSRNLGPLASTHMVIEQKNVSGARG